MDQKERYRVQKFNDKTQWYHVSYEFWTERRELLMYHSNKGGASECHLRSFGP